MVITMLSGIFDMIVQITNLYLSSISNVIGFSIIGFCVLFVIIIILVRVFMKK